MITRHFALVVALLCCVQAVAADKFLATHPDITQKHLDIIKCAKYTAEGKVRSTEELKQSLCFEKVSTQTLLDLYTIYFPPPQTRSPALEELLTTTYPNIRAVFANELEKRSA